MKGSLPVIALLLGAVAPAPAQYIYTVAGVHGSMGSSRDGGKSNHTQFSLPEGVAVDSSGNLYIADDNRVRKVTAAGVVSTIAGNGTAGYSGDGGAATSAQLNSVGSLAVDSSGNVYIADYFNNRVRKVTPAGIISTFAGTGTYAYSGDGGAATSAQIGLPHGVAVDSSGNLYIADGGCNCVRKVTAAGIISTVAGNGAYGYSGDGGAATNAQFRIPWGVAVDASGNLYIVDVSNYCIRKVTAAGIISTVAGNGTNGYSGDGGAATSAALGDYISGVAVDASGNLYIADVANGRVRKVTAAGIISTIAGTGSGNESGDGGLASAATIYPRGLALDTSGNLYITSTYGVRVIAQGTANPLPDFVSKSSVFRAGLWVKDYNANGVWDGTSIDQAIYLGQSGDVPVVGDWNGDGRAKSGIFRNGMWVLDYNGNGVWDGPGTDRLIYLGQSGDTPVVGDWNGSGTAKVGIFRNGLWVLDYNGNGQWDGTGTDKAIFLGQAGDTPVVGDWNAGGSTKAGIFRAGLWVLDYNGNGTWDGAGTDRAFYLGQSGDTPVVGDWNRSGTAKAGTFRSGLWVLDYDGSGTWDGTSVDKAIYLGQAGDTPVVGDWTGNGKTKVGIFRSGLWVLDYDGSGTWDGTATDKAFYLGQSGDVAVLGTW